MGAFARAENGIWNKLFPRVFYVVCNENKNLQQPEEVYYFISVITSNVMIQTTDSFLETAIDTRSW